MRQRKAATLSQFVRDMPKSEIHIHLEGAIQPSTVLNLAERNNRVEHLPSADIADLQAWFKFTDFAHFVEVYMTIQALLRTADDFSLIAYENGADMASQNIRYRELTVTPYTHTHLQHKHLAIEDILAGLEDGRRRARADFGVEMRWVFDIPRNASFPNRDGRRYDPKPAETTLAYALAGRDHGVIGFGLGGHEVKAPPEPFAHAFLQARSEGLLSVPHAGETVGPESIWGALEALQADRLGHGVRAIEDPVLLSLLRERQVPLEINPTSNTCLHVYRRIAEHPFPHLDRMGLLVTVNSDDPPLFDTSLCREYEALAEEFGYDRANIGRIARNSVLASGAEPALRAGLVDELDNWLQANVDSSG